ncbi:MAG TPA: acyltransferase [Pseudonocardiaceae bacterium]|jgi:mycarose O-acyltransferase|nr:acyltransferase [Pseudonocardiaceae bacterium]
MRFVAALVIILFHTTFLGFYPAGAQTVLGNILWEGGYSGVSFFLILSGFLLTWSARSTTGTYWRQRFFRIFPNHLSTLIAAAILLVTVAHTALGGQSTILNIFLLHAWSPQLADRGGFDGVSWLLSCAVLCYLLFPLLNRWISGIRPERLWAWAGGAVAAIVAIPFVAMTLSNGPLIPFTGVTSSQLWIVFQFPPVRALDFVLGMLVARIVVTERRLPLNRGGAVLLAIAAYAVSSLLPATFRLTAIMAVPLALLIAAVAKADQTGRRSWLSSPSIVWLGEVSFAFYLWHLLIFTYVRSWLFVPSTSLGTAIAEVVLLTGISLFVGWLQLVLIERPLRRRFAASRGDRLRSLDVDAVTPVRPEDQAAA